ncbi:helix-turn-helix domain-containing protein [Bacteroides nordii]
MFNGQKIKEIIALRGMTQKEVFTKAGIKETTFYTLFRDDANPSSNILECLADILKCSINDFFDRTTEHTAINLGHHVNGNGNKVSGNISLDECQKELGHLKILLEEKERIINEKERIINEKERTIQILLNK